MDYEGYRKISASDLPVEEQERLRRVLRMELTEAMIRSIHSDPPVPDLAATHIILGPAMEESLAGNTALCLTCGTCGTCGTCLTS